MGRCKGNINGAAAFKSAVKERIFQLLVRLCYAAAPKMLQKINNFNKLKPKKTKNFKKKNKNVLTRIFRKKSKLEKFYLKNIIKSNFILDMPIQLNV